jgi:hypothetical protein
MSALTYGEDELRERAVVRLKKRAQFRSHAITPVTEVVIDAMAASSPSAPMESRGHE